MSSHILRIGRTNYYSVRKGQQQYCIAEGRRVQDLEHCWQVVRDPDSGRNFFVNRSGVRRWHLPDIFQTERERMEEEKQLRFRRQQKQEELRRQRERDGGGAGGGSGNAGGPDEKKSGDGGESEEESDALKGVINQKEVFAARDAAARLLPMLEGWSTPADRKPVTRFAKAVLSPFFHQGTIDEEALAALILTGTREFCAKHPTLGPSEKEELRRDLLSLVQARVDEDTRRHEFQKMNEDLLERLKRLDQERKEQAAKLAEAAKMEEEMKQELFRLRAHKQDVLLHSFKRLTRAGLVQAYWERWTRYKSIVEAQNHVNARERRTKEMADKIKDLEVTLADKDQEVEELRERDQARRARDVINRLLGQLGRDVTQRFFVKWIKFAMERKRERDLYALRMDLANCPRCAQRRVDMVRVSEHVLEAWQATHDLQRELTIKEEEADRHYTASVYWRAMSDFSCGVTSDARMIANAQHSIFAAKESTFRVQDAKIKELTKEVDGLRYEVSMGGGMGAMGRRVAEDDEDGSPLDDGGSGMGGGGGLEESYGSLPPTQFGGGGGSRMMTPAPYGSGAARRGGGGGHAAVHHRAGIRQVDSQQLTSFFLNDASSAESKLERKLAGRAAAGIPPPNEGIVHGGPRGYVENTTQSAIAPSVFAELKGSIPNKSSQPTGTLLPGGSKYYDPVIVGTNTVRVTESAFDQRTREIQQKKAMLERFGTTGRGTPSSPSRRHRSQSPSSSSSDSDDSSSSSSSSSNGGGGSRSPSRRHRNKSKHHRASSRGASSPRQTPTSPSRTGGGLRNNLAPTATTAAAPDKPKEEPLSRYLAEKEARKQQASVLQFIKPPLTAEELAAKRAKAVAEAFETAEEKEAKRCQKCGFRYDSAAFCPKDGTRHTFRSLEMKIPLDDGSGIGGGSVPESVAKLIAAQQLQSGASAQQLLTHRDDPMRVLVMPEYQGATTRQLANVEAPQYLKLPTGMVPTNDDGSIPYLGPPPPAPHPLVQKHTNMLRSSLNLDPRSYQQARVLTLGGDGGVGGERDFVAADVQHPKELVDALNAEEEAALYRDTIDNVRFTRIMTESTRRLTDKASVHSAAAEERQRAYAERSIIAGYNPSADPDSALSLESRLFTSRQQTRNLDKDSLDVPNYFTATKEFATRTNGFQATNTVPTMVQEKLNTRASEYYATEPPMTDNERVQRNIQRYNDPHRLRGQEDSRVSGISTTVNVPVAHGSGGFQESKFGNMNQRGGGGANQPPPNPNAGRTSWSNVFQFNDVLYDRGLGLNAGEVAAGVFGTVRESNSSRPTQAQQLAQQLQSAPNFSRAPR